MIRAVAWDVDGTLADSEPLHHSALIAVSARYGVPIASEDARFIGVGMDEVWSVLQPLYPPGAEQSVWLSDIIAAYLSAPTQLRAIPGALDAMANLHRAGIRQCCVSNSARTVVDNNLAAVGAVRFIEFSISRDDVLRGKPDPMPYTEACHRLGLPPVEVLVVEDSEPGIAAGLAAGCQVLRIGEGHGGFDRVLSLVLGTGQATNQQVRR